MHVPRARQQQPADEGGGEGGESGGGGGEDSDGEGGRHGEGGGGEGVGASCHVCEHARQPTAYSHGEMSDVAARAGLLVAGRAHQVVSILRRAGRAQYALIEVACAARRFRRRGASVPLVLRSAKTRVRQR